MKKKARRMSVSAMGVGGASPTRMDPALAAAPVLLAGWLKKRTDIKDGKPVKNLKYDSRYCTLNTRALMYYKTESDVSTGKEPAGHVPLAGMVLEPYAKDGKSKPKFKVRTPQLQVSFEAPSDVECESWIRTLGNQIRPAAQASRPAQHSTPQPVPAGANALSPPQAAARPEALPFPSDSIQPAANTSASELQTTSQQQLAPPLPQTTAPSMFRERVGWLEKKWDKAKKGTRADRRWFVLRPDALYYYLKPEDVPAGKEAKGKLSLAHATLVPREEGKKEKAKLKLRCEDGEHDGLLSLTAGSMPEIEDWSACLEIAIGLARGGGGMVTAAGAGAGAGAAAGAAPAASGAAPAGAAPASVYGDPGGGGVDGDYDSGGDFSSDDGEDDGVSAGGMATSLPQTTAPSMFRERVGWLEKKWDKAKKGTRADRRWFVLRPDALYYYLKPEDVPAGKEAKGKLSLAHATLVPREEGKKEKAKLKLRCEDGEHDGLLSLTAGSMPEIEDWSACLEIAIGLARGGGGMVTAAGAGAGAGAAAGAAPAASGAAPAGAAPASVYGDPGGGGVDGDYDSGGDFSSDDGEDDGVSAGGMATSLPQTTAPSMFRERVGWLEKKWDKAKKGTRADRRWFVLRPDALYYYLKPEDVPAGKEAKGKLSLAHATLVPREEGKKEKAKLKLRCEDGEHDGLLSLTAGSMPEIEDWSACLEIAIGLARGGGGMVTAAGAGAGAGAAAGAAPAASGAAPAGAAPASVYGDPGGGGVDGDYDSGGDFSSDDGEDDGVSAGGMATSLPQTTAPSMFRERVGWLEKKWDKAKKGTRADRRWFVLRPDALYYYLKPEDVPAGKEAKGKLSLAHATLVPREEGKKEKAKLKLRCEDGEHDGLLSLTAGSMPEIEDWSACLEIAIGLARGGGGVVTAAGAGAGAGAAAGAAPAASGAAPASVYGDPGGGGVDGDYDSGGDFSSDDGEDDGVSAGGMATSLPQTTAPSMFRERVGWLEKKWDKAKKGTRADRRWFVLRPDALYYYLKPEDVPAGKEAKGKLSLAHATLVPREEGKKEKAKLKLRCEDGEHDGLLSLTAGSMPEIEDWSACLEIAIGLARGGGGMVTAAGAGAGAGAAAGAAPAASGAAPAGAAPASVYGDPGGGGVDGDYDSGGDFSSDDGEDDGVSAGAALAASGAAPAAAAAPASVYGDPGGGGMDGDYDSGGNFSSDDGEDDGVSAAAAGVLADADVDADADVVAHSDSISKVATVETAGDFDSHNDDDAVSSGSAVGSGTGDATFGSQDDDNDESSIQVAAVGELLGAELDGRHPVAAHSGLDRMLEHAPPLASAHPPPSGGSWNGDDFESGDDSTISPLSDREAPDINEPDMHLVAEMRLSGQALVDTDDSDDEAEAIRHEKLATFLARKRVDGCGPSFGTDATVTTYRVVRPECHVLRGPELSSEPVGTLRSGEAVEAIDTEESDGALMVMYAISYPPYFGWSCVTYPDGTANMQDVSIDIPLSRKKTLALDTGSRAEFLASQKVLRKMDLVFDAWKWLWTARKHFDRLMRRWVRGADARVKQKAFRSWRRVQAIFAGKVRHFHVQRCISRAFAAWNGWFWTRHKLTQAKQQRRYEHILEAMYMFFEPWREWYRMRLRYRYRCARNADRRHTRMKTWAFSAWSKRYAKFVQRFTIISKVTRLRNWRWMRLVLGNWRECIEADMDTAQVVNQDSDPPETQRKGRKFTTGTPVQIAEAEAYAVAQLGKLYELELKGKGKVQLQLSTMGVQVTEKKGRPPITYRFGALQHWNTTDTGFQLTPTQGKVLEFKCVHMQATEIIAGITSKSKELESAQKAVPVALEEAEEHTVTPHARQSRARSSSGELRLSLDVLPLSELKQRAAAVGIQQHELDDVDDSDDPKQAIIDRLFSAGSLRDNDDLQSLQLSELKERTNVAGASAEDFNSPALQGLFARADHNGDSRLTRAELILQLRNDAQLAELLQLPPAAQPDSAFGTGTRDGANLTAAGESTSHTSPPSAPAPTVNVDLEKTLAMEAKMLHVQEETQAMLMRMQEEASSRELAAKADARRETEAVAEAAAEAAAARIKAETDAVLESVTRTAAATEARYEALIAQQRQEMLRTERSIEAEHTQLHRTKQEAAADAVAQVERLQRELLDEREERRRAEQRVQEQADDRANLVAAEIELQAQRQVDTQLHRTKQEAAADAVAQVERLQRELLDEREERRRAEQRVQEQADDRANLVAAEIELQAQRQVAETNKEAARQAEEAKLQVERRAAEAELDAKKQAILLQKEAAASKQKAEAAAVDAKLQLAKAKVKAKQEESKKARRVAQNPSASQNHRQYRVVRKAAIRASFSTDSEQLGVLESNQIVDAIEVKKNEAGQTRVLVKQANGWVSTKSKSGKVLLRKLDAHSSNSQHRRARPHSALRESDSTSDESGIHRRFLDEDIDAANHSARRASRQRPRRRAKPLSEAVQHASEESAETYTSPERPQKRFSKARPYSSPVVQPSVSVARGPDQTGETDVVCMKSSMSFVGDFSEFPAPGSSKRSAFEDEFKRAIVRCFEFSGIGVSAVNVHIIGYRAGSVIVDFAVTGLPSLLPDQVANAVCEQASMAASSLTGFRVCEFAAVHHNPMAPFVETVPPESLPAPTSIPMVEDRDHSGLGSKHESPTNEPLPPAVPGVDEGCHNARPPDILGYHYHVLHDAVIRSSFAMSSMQTGILRAGEEIRALEHYTDENGRVRVRCDRGWTSLRATNGTLLLRRVNPADHGSNLGNFTAVPRAAMLPAECPEEQLFHSVPTHSTLVGSLHDVQSHLESNGEWAQHAVDVDTIVSEEQAKRKLEDELKQLAEERKKVRRRIRERAVVEQEQMLAEETERVSALLRKTQTSPVQTFAAPDNHFSPPTTLASPPLHVAPQRRLNGGALLSTLRPIGQLDSPGVACTTKQRSRRSADVPSAQRRPPLADASLEVDAVTVRTTSAEDLHEVHFTEPFRNVALRFAFRAWRQLLDAHVSRLHCAERSHKQRCASQSMKLWREQCLAWRCSRRRQSGYQSWLLKQRLRRAFGAWASESCKESQIDAVYVSQNTAANPESPVDVTSSALSPAQGGTDVPVLCPASAMAQRRPVKPVPRASGPKQVRPVETPRRSARSPGRPHNSMPHIHSPQGASASLLASTRLASGQVAAGPDKANRAIDVSSNTSELREQVEKLRTQRHSLQMQKFEALEQVTQLHIGKRLHEHRAQAPSLPQHNSKGTDSVDPLGALGSLEERIAARRQQREALKLQRTTQSKHDNPKESLATGKVRYGDLIQPILDSTSSANAEIAENDEQVLSRASAAGNPDEFIQASDIHEARTEAVSAEHAAGEAITSRFDQDQQDLIATIGERLVSDAFQQTIQKVAQDACAAILSHSQSSHSATIDRRAGCDPVISAIIPLDESINVEFSLEDRLGIGWVPVVGEDGNEAAMVSWINPDGQAATKSHLDCGLVLGSVAVNGGSHRVSVHGMSYSQILEQVKRVQRPLLLVFDRSVVERQLEQHPSVEKTHTDQGSCTQLEQMVERGDPVPSGESTGQRTAVRHERSAYCDTFDEFSSHEAATLIQSVFRGFLVRKQYFLAGASFIDAHEAATCIQMIWRGFIVRRPVLKLSALQARAREEELRLAEAEVESARLAVHQQRLELEAKVAALRSEANRQPTETSAAQLTRRNEVANQEADTRQRADEAHDGPQICHVNASSEHSHTPEKIQPIRSSAEKVDGSLFSAPDEDDMVALAELERSARAEADKARATLAAAEARSRVTNKSPDQATNANERTGIDGHVALDDVPAAFLWRIADFGDHMCAVHPAGVQIALPRSSVQGEFELLAAPWTPVTTGEAEVLTRVHGLTRVDPTTAEQHPSSNVVSNQLLHDFVESEDPETAGVLEPFGDSDQWEVEVRHDGSVHVTCMLSAEPHRYLLCLGRRGTVKFTDTQGKVHILADIGKPEFQTLLQPAAARSETEAEAAAAAAEEKARVAAAEEEAAAQAKAKAEAEAAAAAEEEAARVAAAEEEAAAQAKAKAEAEAAAAAEEEAARVAAAEEEAAAQAKAKAEAEAAAAAEEEAARVAAAEEEAAAQAKAKAEAEAAAAAEEEAARVAAAAEEEAAAQAKAKAEAEAAAAAEEEAARVAAAEEEAAAQAKAKAEAEAAAAAEEEAARVAAAAEEEAAAQAKAKAEAEAEAAAAEEEAARVAAAEEEAAAQAKAKAEAEAAAAAAEEKARVAAEEQKAAAHAKAKAEAEAAAAAEEEAARVAAAAEEEAAAQAKAKAEAEAAAAAEQEAARVAAAEEDASAKAKAEAAGAEDDAVRAGAGGGQSRLETPQARVQASFDPLGFLDDADFVSGSSSSDNDSDVSLVTAAQARSKSLESGEEQEEALPTLPNGGGTLLVDVIACTGVLSADKNGKSDPYVVACVGEVTAKTKHKSKTLNPVFNEMLSLRVPKVTAQLPQSWTLVLEAWDWDRTSKNDFLGDVQVDLRKVFGATGWVDFPQRAFGDRNERLGSNERKQVEHRRENGVRHPYGSVGCKISFVPDDKTHIIEPDINHKAMSQHLGTEVEGDERQAQEEESNRTTHPIMKYKVIAKATVRSSPDIESPTLGEHNKGTIIDVLRKTTTSDGLVMIQTSTPPAGWVKCRTSKGKTLVQQVDGSLESTSSHDDAVETALKLEPVDDGLTGITSDGGSSSTKGKRSGKGKRPSSQSSPVLSVDRLASGGETMYPVKIGRKRAEIYLSGMGLQVFTHKSKIPTTYIYQTMQSWKPYDTGFVLTTKDGEVDFTTDQADDICKVIELKALQLIGAQQTTARGSTVAPENTVGVQPLPRDVGGTKSEASGSVTPEPPPEPAPKQRPKRRFSVANRLSSVDMSAQMLQPGQTLWTVKQSHIKQAPSSVQLLVGASSLTLFENARTMRPLTSIQFGRIVSSKANTKRLLLELQAPTEEVALVSKEAKQIKSLLKEQQRSFQQELLRLEEPAEAEAQASTQLASHPLSVPMSVGSTGQGVVAPAKQTEDSRDELASSEDDYQSEDDLIAAPHAEATFDNLGSEEDWSSAED